MHHSESQCPAWCVAPHGRHPGEEDWVHLSEPMPLANNLPVRICMTVDPRTGTQDGPYVLLGSTELTPGQALDVGLAIQGLANVARATPPAAL